MMDHSSGSNSPHPWLTRQSAAYAELRQSKHGWKHDHRAPPAGAQVRSPFHNAEGARLEGEQIIRGLRGDPFITILFSAPNEDLIMLLILRLVLKKDLQNRSGSWPQIVADLDSLTETEIEYDRKRFLLRSAPRRQQHHVLMS